MGGRGEGNDHDVDANEAGADAATAARQADDAAAGVAQTETGQIAHREL